MTLDEEMAWTTWADSCRDPYPPFRQCRRPRKHDGDHASGFGANRLIWPRTDESNQ